MKREIFNKIISRVAPWITGIVAFWLVTNIFFAPQRDGMSLDQGDIRQYAGMSEDIRQMREATGEDPQWTGNMFSGMPAYMIDIEYPTQSVKQTVGSVVKVIDSPMNMIFFAMVVMMLSVVLMGINPWIGIVAGLAYGLSTYFFLIVGVGHITKMWALVYAPALVAAVWHTLRRNMWLGGSLAALFGSLELAANHPQITYYFLLACVALWLSEAWFAFSEKRIKDYARRSLVLLVAAIFAVASNFSPLRYTLEHHKYTTRATSEATYEEDAREEKIAYNTAWSYGCKESFNMLVPNYMGSWSGDFSEDVARHLQSRGVQEAMFNDSLDELTEMLRQSYPDLQREDVEYLLNAGDETLAEHLYTLYELRWSEASKYASNYWGDQPYTAGPTYLGASVLLLAILGLILTSNRNRWWLIAVSLFAILLAWGSNLMGFYRLMFDILPGYASFRTVSMALVVVEWSVPLLAAIALMELWRTELGYKQLAVRATAAFGVVVALVAVMWAVADFGVQNINEELGNGWWVEQLKESALAARRSAFTADAWRTLLYAGATTAIVILYARFKERKEDVAKIALVLASVAVIVADMALVDGRYLNEESWHKGAPTDIEPSEANLAIMADKELGFRVLDLTSDPFNSANASYFHRSVGGYHGAKLGRYQDVIDRYLRTEDGNMLAALNTKYVIFEGEALEFKHLYDIEPYGAAWLVERTTKKPSPAEELDALGSTDLRTTAVVASDSDLAATYNAEGTIALVEYHPNYLRYEYDGKGESLAVFSEVYFADGWRAFIDGEEADYHAVDYILRGMELPQGKHTIEWRFRAPSWTLNSAITGIASWAILIALVITIVLAIKKIWNKEISE